MGLKETLQNLWKKQEQTSREEELQRKEREAKKRESDMFIYSQYIHETKKKEEARAAEEEAEQKQADEQRQNENPEATGPSSKEQQMAEADDIVDTLGVVSDPYDPHSQEIVASLVRGKKISDLKKSASAEEATAETAQSPEAQSSQEAGEAENEGAQVGAESAIRGNRAIQIGNTLRLFVRYMESVENFSAKHVQAGRICSNILLRAQETGVPLDEMGLNADEWSAVRGTVEMGRIIRDGLAAKNALSNPENNLLPQERFVYMRNFLSMKAVEQVMQTHVRAHHDFIQSGDAPFSPIQLLLGTPGFSAQNIHTMVGQTESMRKFMTMDNQKVSDIINRNSLEMDDLAGRAMAACYNDNLRQPHAVQPQEPSVPEPHPSL